MEPKENNPVRGDHTPGGDNSFRRNLYSSLFNPVFITLAFVLLVLLYLCSTWDIPFFEALTRLFAPGIYECRNIEGGLALFFTATSYCLAFVVFICCFIVIYAETARQYVVSSIIGILATGAWLGWGIIYFILCGIRVN